MLRKLNWSYARLAASQSDKCLRACFGSSQVAGVVTSAVGGINSAHPTTRRRIGTSTVAGGGATTLDHLDALFNAGSDLEPFFLRDTCTTIRAGRGAQNLGKETTCQDGCHQHYFNESQIFSNMTNFTDFLSSSTIITMSSLSRRACYKCGELGHHAEACSSPHRLCYNCKLQTSISSSRPVF